MNTNPSRTSLCASRFIRDLLMLLESFQQIRVADNHTPTPVLTHVGQPTARIDRESGQRSDRLLVRQGDVPQQAPIVVAQHLKTITAS